MIVEHGYMLITHFHKFTIFPHCSSVEVHGTMPRAYFKLIIGDLQLKEILKLVVVFEYHTSSRWLTLAHGGSRWLTVVDPVPNKVDPVVRGWLTVISRWLTVNPP